MNTKKITVGILFGGKSAEHEVSLQSAKNIFEEINREKYNPIPIGIDKSGKWLLYNNENFLINPNDPKRIELNKSNDIVTIYPECNGEIIGISNQIREKRIDVIFPVLHGPFGEDGTVQGLFKLANIPFVGASILGSAIGMDKDVMKNLLHNASITIGKSVTIHSHERVPTFESIQEEIGIPCFIKPANMGSSIGVNKVKNKDEYIHAVKDAFLYDTKILIEEYIEGREIECAVLGNENPSASTVGEIIPQDEFYSYDAKYIDEKGAILEIPIKLPSRSIRKIQQIAIKTFKALFCEGLGRVDMFIKKNGEIYVNEINTMPGFTKISMYPKLWEASGIKYSELIDKLIQLGIKRFVKEKKLTTRYF